MFGDQWPEGRDRYIFFLLRTAPEGPPSLISKGRSRRQGSKIGRSKNADFFWRFGWLVQGCQKSLFSLELTGFPRNIAIFPPFSFRSPALQFAAQKGGTINHTHMDPFGIRDTNLPLKLQLVPRAVFKHEKFFAVPSHSMQNHMQVWMDPPLWLLSNPALDASSGQTFRAPSRAVWRLCDVQNTEPSRWTQRRL